MGKIHPSESKISHANVSQSLCASLRPKARTDQLVVRTLDAETLVYDLKAHIAICLDERATTIWSCCDGERSPTEIAFAMQNSGVSDREVESILARLAAYDLFEESYQSGPSLDRRDAIFGASAALASASASVIAITAPSPSQAASGTPCLGDSDCGVLEVCIDINGTGAKICVGI
jgi:hypothetical protein